MQTTKYKEVVKNLLSKVGVEINGPNSWDLRVHNQHFYRRVLANPHLGLGESYMDGWWDAERLDELFFRLVRGNLEDQVKTWDLFLHFLKAKIYNYQKKGRAMATGRKHYDLGNNLYRHMLDKTMAYTCGYWKEAKNLEEAQLAKMDLVCKKVGLKPGMRVLDIGCGWGSFMKYAAEKYQVKLTGITISKEQVKLGQELCEGLPVEFQLRDYRDIEGQFDRVISIGMFEAVGHKNHRTFMKTVHRCLKDDGLFLLHTIGWNESVTSADPWINKYIFPVGVIPSLKQLGGAMEKLFVLEDLHNFGADYDKTLMAWFENFDRNWDAIKVDYDSRFYRMWKYYLLSCAGMFRARKGQLWQLVLSKNGLLGGYNSVRL